MDGPTADGQTTPLPRVTPLNCTGCGCRILGVNGRYACGRCGHANPWHEGSIPLPTGNDTV